MRGGEHPVLRNDDAGCREPAAAARAVDLADAVVRGTVGKIDVIGIDVPSVITMAVAWPAHANAPIAVIAVKVFLFMFSPFHIYAQKFI